MASRKKSDRVAEYGDFQTPMYLARQVCDLLSRRNLHPASILEPTCGVGNFLIAALDQFPAVTRAVGLDVNPSHVQTARSSIQGRQDDAKVALIEKDFFDTDWSAILHGLPDPLLLIGNPPWVTNAALGILGSSNLPRKTNFKKHAGLDAITGKSNFDISEWMFLQFLDWLDGRCATMAVLCKTAVARKVLLDAWRRGIHLNDSAMYLIDAATSFGASVDACLLICDFTPSSRGYETPVYKTIADDRPVNVIGYRDDSLVADIDAHERWKHLQGKETYRWRSGIKHDCAKVMELCKEERYYRNGFHELLTMESDFLFPMLKGSDIANGRTDNPRRWMLVTQRRIGEDTTVIKERAPQTWSYLQSHAQQLARRASSIYRNRPRFSVFGVGDYSFAPWKVAISGFYKRLDFRVVGGFAGKPIVLDDTCYFVACETEEEARYVASLLNSPIAREFFSAFMFWDMKRPVTVDNLRRLNLIALANELGSENTISKFLALKSADAAIIGESCSIRQLSLFRD